MNISKYSSNLFRDFTVILSSNVVFASLFFKVFSIDSISPSLLWQMTLISLIAAFFDIVFYLEGWIGDRPLLLKTAVHFVLIYVFFLSSAWYFQWFRAGDTVFVIRFSVFLLIGYAVVYALLYVFEMREARVLNLKLKEYKHRRSDTAGKE